MYNKDVELIDDPPPERTFTQQEVKLYQDRVVLTYLDSPVFNFEGCFIPTDVPVKIFSEDMRIIGFANLLRKSNCIEAEIFVDYSSEERLLVETGERLFVQFTADLEGIDRSFDLFQRIRPYALKIVRLTLTRTSPIDSRILPLGLFSNL